MIKIVSTILDDTNGNGYNPIKQTDTIRIAWRWLKLKHIICIF